MRFEKAKSFSETHLKIRFLLSHDMLMHTMVHGHYPDRCPAGRLRSCQRRWLVGRFFPLDSVAPPEPGSLEVPRAKTGQGISGN